MARRFDLGEWADKRMRLDRCLSLLNGPYVEIDKVRAVPVSHVLAEPWSQQRLKRALSLLSEGQKAPPIFVTGFRLLNGPVLYSVGDGLHRTCAARMVGKRTVRALVGCIHAVDPSGYRLYQGRVWCVRGSRLELVMADPTHEELSDLAHLGVPRMENVAC